MENCQKIWEKKRANIFMSLRVEGRKATVKKRWNHAHKIVIFSFLPESKFRNMTSLLTILFLAISAVYYSLALPPDLFQGEKSMANAKKCCEDADYDDCCLGQLENEESLKECWQLNSEELLNIAECARRAFHPQIQKENLFCCAIFNNIEPIMVSKMSCKCINLHLNPMINQKWRTNEIERMVKDWNWKIGKAKFKAYNQCILASDGGNWASKFEFDSDLERIFAQKIIEKCTNHNEMN